jgi:hypothetical protein
VKTFAKISANIFAKISAIFVNLLRNFRENENKFSQKFSQKCKNENFRYNPSCRSKTYLQENEISDDLNTDLKKNFNYRGH